MGVPEVVKGGFTYTVAGKSLTLAAKGVTKVRFKKVGVGSFGDWVILDLTGKSWVFNFDTQFNAAGCGITETVSWANAMPWTDYLVNLDNDKDNVVAGMSRNPCASVTPAAANIHYNDSVSATEAQTNFMLAIAAGTDYAAAPCVAIGSHTMTYNTADDDWTPGTIAATDGFGKFQEGVQFVFPLGQNGAAANSHYSSAGTAPVFTTDTLLYSASMDGNVTFSVLSDADGGTDGAGANQMFLRLPLAGGYGGNSQYTIIPAYCIGQTTIASGVIAFVEIKGDSALGGMVYNSGATAVSYITSGMFSAGARTVWAGGTYKAF